MTPRLPALFLTLLALTGVVWAEETEVEEQPEVTIRSKQPRQVEVRWKAAPEATGYELWRQLGENGPWKKMLVLPGKRTRYLDKTLQPRSLCSYMVVDQTTDGRNQRSPAGPIEALDDFYVELKEVKGARARVRVHKWSPELSQWLRSTDVLEVRVGQTIGEDDILGDLSTGAKLIKTGTEPKEPGVQFIRYLTKDRRLIRVTTVDVIPDAVLPRKKKKKKKKKGKKKKKEKESGTRGPGSDTGATSRPALKFPQPKIVGQVKGSRIVWEIANFSRFKMSFVISGRNRRTFKVGPQKTHVVKLPSGGTYSVTVNASDNKVVPLKGRFGLLPGTKYRTEFGVRSVNKKP